MSESDAAKLIRYREAIEVLTYMGVFKDTENLIHDIESGAFSDEYEIIKGAAIHGKPEPSQPAAAQINLPSENEYQQLAHDIGDPLEGGEYLFTPETLDAFVFKLFGHAMSLSGEQIQALARPAAGPSEPVAWMTKQTRNGKKILGIGEATTNKAYTECHKEWLWIPLCIIPAAPAVPDALTELPEEVPHMSKSSYVDGWNDCREALIAAASEQQGGAEQTNAKIEAQGQGSGKV